MCMKIPSPLFFIFLNVDNYLYNVPYPHPDNMSIPLHKPMKVNCKHFFPSFSFGNTKCQEIFEIVVESPYFEILIIQQNNALSNLS